MAPQRDRPDVVEAREWFIENRAYLDPQNLVFLDETGCHPGIGPRRGWAPSGQPLFGPEQTYARGKHHSIIGAVSLAGTVARSTFEGGVGTKEFLSFVKYRLAPKLRPGQIVCMDNLNAHKNRAARKLINAVGAEVLFLPPYSPEFNPIEAVWSKLKKLIRKSIPKDCKELKQAIAAAWRKISATDTAGYFRYCGY